MFLYHLYGPWYSDANGNLAGIRQDISLWNEFRQYTFKIIPQVKNVLLTTVIMIQGPL